jgi:putative flippase GtrA
MEKSKDMAKRYIITKTNIFKNQIIEIIKFSIVGIINTLADFVVFFLCYSIFRFSYSISQVFGYSSGMLNSFIMNKKWTFKDKTTGKVVIIKMLKFIITNIISLSCSIVVIKFSKSYLSNSILLSKVLATICAQGINYFSYKYIVFGINKQEIIRK